MEKSMKEIIMHNGAHYVLASKYARAIDTIAAHEKRIEELETAAQQLICDIKNNTTVNQIEVLISDMFKSFWHGTLRCAPFPAQLKELQKNLSDQVNGYWSGSSAYAIMISGGFLVDGKSCTEKKLTALGKMVMNMKVGSIVDTEA